MSIMEDRSKLSRSIKEKKNGFKIVERKKISNSISNYFYNLSKTEKEESLKKALQKRSARLRFCGEKKHILSVNGIAHNLYSHKCRDRQCIDCQAIRSYVWQKKISEVNEILKGQLNPKEYSFLFLTFTVKNPAVKDLNATLKLMNKAIYQLFKHKKYIVGGIRTTEITRGKSARNECHPHFHLLLIVHNSFFDDKVIEVKNGKHTLPDVEAEFSQDFGRYLERYSPDFKLNFDWKHYEKTETKGPKIEVCRAVAEDRKTYIGLENAVENGGQIFGYILKYTVKGNGKADDIIFKNDMWFLEYDKQIKNVRLITPVGIYKKLLSELESKDYDFNEELQKIEKQKIAIALKQREENKQENTVEEAIEEIEVECDIYAYKKRDYIVEESNLSLEEKIENAILAKTHNQFKRAYVAFADNAKHQLEATEKFLNNDYVGNENRIFRMKKLLDIMEAKGYFINLENGSYCDRKTGEIYTLIQNIATDNTAIDNIKIDKFKMLDLMEKQEILNDIEAQKQNRLSLIIAEAATSKEFTEMMRLSREQWMKAKFSEWVKDNIKIDIIDNADDMFK
jgi:hypothetical protein